MERKMVVEIGKSATIKGPVIVLNNFPPTTLRSSPQVPSAKYLLIFSHSIKASTWHDFYAI